MDLKKVRVAHSLSAVMECLAQQKNTGLSGRREGYGFTSIQVHLDEGVVLVKGEHTEMAKRATEYNSLGKPTRLSLFYVQGGGPINMQGLRFT